MHNIFTCHTVIIFPHSTSINIIYVHSPWIGKSLEHGNNSLLNQQVKLEFIAGHWTKSDIKTAPIPSFSDYSVLTIKL